MRLHLTLSGGEGELGDETPVRAVGPEGISIGRGPDNGWVLPDPAKHLSKRHCEIAFDGKQFILTDTSTNGVFLNGSEDRIGRNQAIDLQDGDQIALGNYHIDVLVEADDAAGLPDDTAYAGAPDPYLDPLADEDRGPKRSASARFDDDPLLGDSTPFARDGDLAGGVPDPFRDGFADGSADDIQPGVFPGTDFDRDVGHGLEDGVGSGDPLFDGPPPASDGSIPEDIDIFGDGDARPSGAGQRVPDDDDLFGPPAEQGPVVSDHIADESSHMPLPTVERFETAGKRGEVIPEDWDLDLGPGPAEPPPRADAFDDLMTPAARPDTPPQATRQPAPLPDDAFDDLLGPDPARGPAPSAPPARPQAAARQAPPAQGRRPARQTAPAPMPSDADGDALLDAFFAGAGMDTMARPPFDPLLMMRQLGEAYRIMVEGLSDVLSARTNVKREFRMEQTMIQVRGNNPLKFSGDIMDALSALLFGPQGAFMPAPDAVAEGFKDVKAHQMAVMAGMQVALQALIERFDPASLEGEITKTSVLDGILPGARKAKYWELYEERYRQIASEAEDDFHSLFGSNFALAYERQIKGD